jgi:predicted transcriptional regulator
MTTKHLTSIRLTPDAKRLLEILAEKLGVSQSAVLELAIRDKAKRESVK